MVKKKSRIMKTDMGWEDEGAGNEEGGGLGKQR